ncbi:MAG: cytidylate kinase-like family protein [Spirochaetes bacterium]|nr:MAG: cytidylate kinase-like family protein [Spirochaetota bacterium]
MKNNTGLAMETLIGSQISYWKQQREKIELYAAEKPFPSFGPFVTISREYGCGGFETALRLADVLNAEYSPEPPWLPYHRGLLEKVIHDMGLSAQLAETLTATARDQMTNLLQTTFSKFPPQVAVHRKLAETVRTLATHGNVIIVGRAGKAITREMEKGYHVRIVAPLEWRADRIASILGMGRREAEKIIAEKSKLREDYLRAFVKFDSADPHHYHLLVNNAFHGTDDIVRLVIQGMRLKGLLARPAAGHE